MRCRTNAHEWSAALAGGVPAMTKGGHDSARGASLESFFAPKAIAVVGASPDAGKIRGALLQALCKGGYRGRIYPVNPSYQEIDGLACFPSLAAIGAPVDVALIAIPAASVPAALEECAAAGVRHAVIISSGFAEGDAADLALEARVAQVARRTTMRICGPNAEGFYNDLAHLTATFSPALEPRAVEEPLVANARRIGVVAQSGGVGFSFFNSGRALGLAFSSIVSTGNEADLTASEFLEPPACGIATPRSFSSSSRACAIRSASSPRRARPPKEGSRSS